MKAMKAMLPYVRRHPALWAAGLALPSLANLSLNLAFAYGLQAYTQELMRPDAAIGRVAAIMAAVLAAMLVSTLLEDATRYMFQVFVIRTENHIRQDLFTKLISARCGDAAGFDRGELLTRYNQDAAIATNLVSWDLHGVLFPAVLGTGYLTAIFCANAVIGAIMLGLAAAVILLNAVFVSRFTKLQATMLGYREGYARACESAVQGKMSVRQLSAGAAFAAVIGREAGRLYRGEMDIVSLTAKRAVSVDLLATATGALAAPLACVFSEMGWIALPGIILIAQLSRYLILFTNSLGVALTSFGSHSVSHARLNEVLTLPGEDGGCEAVPEDNGSLLEFEHVGISYDGIAVLTDVNLTVRRGEVVALAGPSGTGKSSLVKALLRLVSYSGDIRFCGVETGALRLAELRRAIAYVPEHSELFDATVYENIACANPSADGSRVECALRRAALGGEPDMPGRQAGENGSKLSGGQRQRVAIARALVKNAQLYIMDEPTAALDAGSEQQVLQTISALRNMGKGVLLITHRESTLRIADRILEIRDKTIGPIPSDEAEPVTDMTGPSRR